MDQDLLVFALKATDDYLHVGKVGDVLAHFNPTVVADTGPDGLALLQFYDRTGAPLVVDRTGAAPVLAPSAAPPDPVTGTPPVLVDRIALVLARAQVAFDVDDNVALAALRVPHLDGPLPVVVAALAEWLQPLPPFGDPNSPNSGGPVHNALHKVGLAHLFG